ncbi:hypothetical protein OPT61_g7073 [Boeremia exigua]|uniref:Uncharacterized protein n=1 Tax=Boeremia exigua TaxID=749465 RepID=A0ACC2I3R3_9PLEO|nr:hypothetical protein OPT61_g7073 [Boeremia exigua]
MPSPNASNDILGASSQGPEVDPTTPSHNACCITSLPTDIIYRIIDFLPLESLVNFACMCKSIADSSSRILKRHQEAYSKYRVASDISPATIPTLLRSAFGRADPLFIWHVRSIEIWYDRTSWSDWKPLSFDEQLQETSVDVDSTPWKWQGYELEEFLKDVEDQFDAMMVNGDEDIRVEARDHLEGGLDGILKMLLIAHCPRLRDVKFITREHDNKSTLGWLKRVIQGSIQCGSHWPPGLRSIRDIFVGVESGTWMTKPITYEETDLPNISMEVFSTLLRLPQLNSIYYKDLQHPDLEDEIDYDTDTLMPPSSSTVQHIFLDDCSDMPHTFVDALSKAPLALETFTLRTSGDADLLDDADALVSCICSKQSGSLHTLMLYGPYDHGSIHGYRCSCYRNEELNDARHLQTVAMDIYDVELDCMYSCAGSGEMTEDEQRKYFIRWFRETAFPNSIERLVFWGKLSEVFLEHSKGKFLDWLEDALIDSIEPYLWVDGWESPDEEEDDDDASSSCDAFYQNLKAVHLEEIERQYRENKSGGGPLTTKVYFQKLVEVGKKAGIDIHTLTNRAPPIHTPQLPTAPEKWDLQTGPWWERRDEFKDWVFDVYKGRMVPPGCGKCGKCKKCLSLYSAELWKSLGK